ncbi:glycosyltransferase [Streptococcus pneumoniae]|nr:glycosyltransferase [Streptococcus pneumoniae]MDG9224975.1 glycosyltransferase [Streptococcus pneumoniae]
MKDLVSVVIPVYNVENYLEECIQSVLNQTYTNLDIVLVNDGSTDASAEICDRFAEIDDRARVFHTENRGAALAKNVGVTQALGEYVLFVDSDDIAEKRMVETLYRQVEETGADIVIGNYFLYDENDGQYKLYVLERDFCIEELSAQELIDRQAGKWHLNASAFIMPVFKLFKKDLLLQVPFTNGRRFDDEATIHRLFIKSQKTIFVNDNLYIYRVRKGSIMTSQFDLSWVQDILQVFSSKLADLLLAVLIPVL